MKRFLSLILAAIIVCSLASLTAFAKNYTAFDIVFDEIEGEIVNNTEIKVFASVDDGELEDRTSEFTMEDVRWYKYLSEPEEGKTADDYDYVDEEAGIYGTLVSDTDVYEFDNYSYFLIISRLYAQEEDGFDRNVKINGVDIDALNGSCYNTGNEFYIKTIANGQGDLLLEDTQSSEEVEQPDEVQPEPVDDSTEDTEEKCKVCGVCPIQPLGICLFIWIAIIVVIIIVIVIVICVAKKKKNNK